MTSMKMRNVGFAIAALMSSGAIAATTTPSVPTTATLKKARTPSRKAVSRKDVKIVSAATSTSAPRLRSKVQQSQVRDALSSSSSSTASTASLPGITAGSSTATGGVLGAKKKSFTDGIRASIGLEYYGSSLSNPLSGWQTDKGTGFGEGEAPVELDTRLTVGYQLTPNLQLSYNAYFWSYGDSPDGETSGETFGFKPAASYLKIGVGKFVQAGKFKWNGDFRFYPGLGESGDRVPLYFRTGQNFTYGLSARTTLAAYNTVRYYHRTSTAYVPERDPKGNVLDFRTTVSPTLEHQLTDSVGSYLSFNMDFAHSHKNGTIDETANFKGPDYGSYFELGGSIDFSKHVNLNPYIDAYTKTMNVEAMQIGANLAITIL